MFPITQVREFVTQITDPERKPTEPTPRRWLTVEEVLKKMRWTGIEQIQSAAGRGFPSPRRVSFKKKAGGGVTWKNEYPDDRIDLWR
jgi:hypothetical protein